MAIEDSVLLSQALQRRYRFKSYDSFTVSSFGEEQREKEDEKGTDRRHLFERDAHTVDMKAVLLDVEEARYKLHLSVHLTSHPYLSIFISIFIFVCSSTESLPSSVSM